jgi:hypothetical protein
MALLPGKDLAGEDFADYLHRLQQASQQQQLPFQQQWH